MEETRLSGESHQPVIVIDKYKIAFGTLQHEGRRPRKYFLVIDWGSIYKIKLTYGRDHKDYNTYILIVLLGCFY